MDAKAVGQVIDEHVAAFWRTHDCGTACNHGPHQCDASCGADIAARFDAEAGLDEWTGAALSVAESPASGELRGLLDAALGNISARINRGIGEGSLAAARWRDALIDVGVMVDDLINEVEDTPDSPTPEPE